MRKGNPGDKNWLWNEGRIFRKLNIVKDKFIGRNKIGKMGQWPTY